MAALGRRIRRDPQPGGGEVAAQFNKSMCFGSCMRMNLHDGRSGMGWKNISWSQNPVRIQASLDGLHRLDLFRCIEETEQMRLPFAESVLGGYGAAEFHRVRR